MNVRATDGLPRPLPINQVFSPWSRVKVFYRLNRRWHSWRFDRSCGAILQTAPIKSDRSRCFVVSMVHHAAVIPYLVAIKSFSRFFGPADFVVLDDGSLTNADRKTIQHHLQGSHLISASHVRDDRVPAGGCWERLCLLADFAADKYVVQLDSDTITFRPPDAIIQHVEDDQAFTLGGHALASKRSTLEYRSKWETFGPREIQSLAEVAMLELHERWPYYIEGCAALTGFPKGSITRDEIVELSNAFEERLDAEWNRWGSEQFASNLLVANLKGSEVLPFPEYSSFVPEYAGQLNSSTLLHFYGTHRYDQGRYLRAGIELTDHLSRT